MRTFRVIAGLVLALIGFGMAYIVYAIAALGVSLMGAPAKGWAWWQVMATTISGDLYSLGVLGVGLGLATVGLRLFAGALGRPTGPDVPSDRGEA